jgi:hypothetical protein
MATKFADAQRNGKKHAVQMLVIALRKLENAGARCIAFGR